MSTARDFLAAVQQRADAATEGPWTFQHWGSQNQNGDYAESILFDGDGETSTYGLADRDGEFIAASRTDVPRLVAFALAVDTARERVRRLRNEGLLTPAEAHDVLDESIRTAADKHLTLKENDS